MTAARTPALLPLHKPAQLFHGVDRGFGQDAVAQVEDVTGTSGGLTHDVFGARPHFLPVCKQKNRVEISLYRTLEIHLPPAFVERNSPVQANDFCSGFLHRGQQGCAIGAEVNDRHAGLLQFLYQVGDMREHVAPVILDAQATYPTVEDLDGVCPGASPARSRTRW